MQPSNELDQLRQQHAALLKALCDMTPGGSEFVGDANRCLENIRHQIRTAHGFKDAAMQKARKAEAERDELAAQKVQMRRGLSAVEVLILNSFGVSGLHLNGDDASWESLRTGGQFEGWLAEFDAALALAPTEAEKRVAEWREKAAWFDDLEMCLTSFQRETRGDGPDTEPMVIIEYAGQTIADHSLAGCMRLRAAKESA